MQYMKVLAHCDYKLVKRKKQWVILKDGIFELASFATKMEAYSYLENYLEKMSFKFDYRIFICGYIYYYYEDNCGKRIRVYF